MRQGEYEIARDYAIRAIGLNPNSIELLLVRSKAELELKNTNMAVTLNQIKT